MRTNYRSEAPGIPLRGGLFLAMAVFLAACGGGGSSLPLNPGSYPLTTFGVVAGEATPGGGSVLVLRLSGVLQLITCDTATGQIRHRVGPAPFTTAAILVDSGQGCGGLVGVVDNINGRLHLAYVRDSGGGPEVAHAWWNGLVWTIDPTVFAVGATGGAPELLLGPVSLHLVYHNAMGADTVLAYAEWPAAGPGPWTAPLTIDLASGKDYGGNPAIAYVGASLYVASFDSTTGGIRMAHCATTCTTLGNWTVGALVPTTGAELDLAVNPVNGSLNLLYRDQTGPNLSLRQWPPTTPFSPGPAQIVMTTIGTTSPEVALAVEPNGRRHVYAWTESGGLLQLRHRYGFGLFITDGASPYVAQTLAPLPGPIAPLLPVLANGSIYLGWASNIPAAGARWEQRTPLF